MSSSAIALEHVSKRFGAVEALRDISLEVAAGQVFGFLGLNGAGKTTTIRILLDLLRPTSGSARIFGLDCHESSLATRRMIGYLPGELGLYGDMTGAETLDLFGRLDGAATGPRATDDLLDRFELARGDLRRRIREYSTGMRRKLGLVMALGSEAPLVVLDEPTEGLDPLVQRTLNDVLFEIRSSGRTVFMSSHVLSEIERVCDRIAVIRRGEIALETTVEEARKLGGRRIRIRFDRDIPAGDAPPDARVLEASPREWHLAVDGEIGELVRALARLPIRDMEIVEPALEDVLRRFYREDEP